MLESAKKLFEPIDSVAATAALGYCIDKLIVAHTASHNSDVMKKDLEKVLDVFTVTEHIFLFGEDYFFPSTATLDEVFDTLLKLLNAVRETGAYASELFESDTEIGFTWEDESGVPHCMGAKKLTK